MKKVFRRTLFEEVCMREGIVSEHIVSADTVSEAVYKEALNTWVKWCDGMEVIDGYINNYNILDAWCEIIEK